MTPADWAAEYAAWNLAVEASRNAHDPDWWEEGEPFPYSVVMAEWDRAFTQSRQSRVLRSVA